MQNVPASKQLSVVVPVYNEAKTVPELHKRFENFLSFLKQRHGLDRSQVEVLLVNDGSRDETLAMLRAHFDTEPYVIVNLSRNHGHQLAITAGIDQTVGDAVVLIDGDLQDPPEFIVDLYAKFLEGFDVVYAVRKTRQNETWFKLASASLYYRLLRKITNIDLPLNTGDFRIISRRVADLLSSMKEPDRFIRGLISWIGFKQTGLEYHRQGRYEGETKYTFFRMLKFSLDGITSFSAMPLRLVSIFGMICAVFGFLYGSYAVYVKLFTDRAIVGWTSQVVIVVFMGGVQLLSIGLIGEYLRRVSEQVKQRPLYMIDTIIRPNSKSI
jgi:dolichol-phosphate mannosyltransferase